jgi:hypothetical protein
MACRGNVSYFWLPCTEPTTVCQHPAILIWIESGSDSVSNEPILAINSVFLIDPDPDSDPDL